MRILRWRVRHAEPKPPTAFLTVPLSNSACALSSIPNPQPAIRNRNGGADRSRTGFPHRDRVMAPLLCPRRLLRGKERGFRREGNSPASTFLPDSSLLNPQPSSGCRGGIRTRIDLLCRQVPCCSATRQLLGCRAGVEPALRGSQPRVRPAHSRHHHYKLLRFGSGGRN